MKKDEIGRACRPNWGEDEGIWDIVGKSKRKRPLGRPRRRWVDLREIEGGGMD
jgi:hypothetical protein